VGSSAPVFAVAYRASAGKSTGNDEKVMTGNTKAAQTRGLVAIKKT
jgi:hypothetical protein